MIKIKLFYNNGHHLADGGAAYRKHQENIMTIELGNILVPLLRTLPNVEVYSVPDNLNLKETIAWINERADKGSFAFSTHFNSNANKFVRGTEAYYSEELEKKTARVFSRHVAKALMIPDGGAVHDSKTWVGSLGFLRKLKCPSNVVEVCYLTNSDDMVHYDPHEAAQGIYEAVKEIVSPDIEQLKVKIGILQRMVMALQKLRALIIKKNTMENKKFGALSSSADPNKLGTTVKAAILGAATSIIWIGGVLGFDIAQSQIALIAEQVGYAITSIGILYGLAQKAVITINERYFM